MPRPVFTHPVLPPSRASRPGIASIRNRPRPGLPGPARTSSASGGGRRISLEPAESAGEDSPASDALGHEAQHRGSRARRRRTRAMGRHVAVLECPCFDGEAEEAARAAETKDQRRRRPGTSASASAWPSWRAIASHGAVPTSESVDEGPPVEPGSPGRFTRSITESEPGSVAALTPKSPISTPMSAKAGQHRDQHHHQRRAERVLPPACEVHLCVEVPLVPPHDPRGGRRVRGRARARKRNATTAVPIGSSRSVSVTCSPLARRPVDGAPR